MNSREAAECERSTTATHSDHGREIMHTLYQAKEGGKTQYRENGVWMDVDFDGAAEPVLSPKGKVEFVCEGNPKYYRHFTVSRIDNGWTYLQGFGQDSDFTPLSSIDGTLDEGYYVLTTGTRLSSGGVLAHMEFFTIREGETVKVPLTLRKSEDKLSVIGNMDPEQLFLADGAKEQQSILSATGRGVFLLAVTGDKDEPSSHAIVHLDHCLNCGSDNIVHHGHLYSNVRYPALDASLPVFIRGELIAHGKTVLACSGRQPRRIRLL